MSDPRRRLRWVLGVIFVLIGIVAVAAAIISFATLRSLAERSGFSGELAWLLPIVLDAGALAGSTVFLFTRKGSKPHRSGGRLAVSLLVMSIFGNAADHYLGAYSITPPWWLIVIVSAIAPSVLGTMVHLAGLLVRWVDMVETGQVSPELDEDRPNVPTDGEPATLAEMIAAGWGRNRIASKLNIEPKEARRLMYQHGKTQDAPDETIEVA